MLVVIEGPDGTGKRTQSHMLGEHLIKEGFRVKHYSYPNYSSPYGKLIKEHLLGVKNRSTNELFLDFLADMVAEADSVKRDIEEGKIVIMDRYFHSTVAYQSAGGFDYESAKTVEKLFALRLPDLAMYVDMPISTSMVRKQRQRNLEGGESDLHEKSRALQERVKHFYEKMVEDGFGARGWVKIDGSGGVEEVHKRIVDAFDSTFIKTKAKLALH